MSRLFLLLLLAGCGDDDAPGDAGPDGSDAAEDGGQDAGEDAADDASTDGCVRVTAGDFILDNMDDVSIRYAARLSPEIEDRPYDFFLELNRYGDAEYEGTFPLDEGPDSSFGSCAHCVFASYGATFGERMFFVSEGALELRDDPFTRHLDATFSDVRLVEVELVGDSLESVPIPGGLCIVLEDVTVDETYPGLGWTCDEEKYEDGETCDCMCGAFDPDCDGQNPIAGCDEGELCLPRLDAGIFTSECVETCDVESRDTCSRGVCGYGADADLCYTDPATIDSARIGETCDDEAQYCNLVSGFVEGFCDVWDRADHVCRRACDEESDCNDEAFERCYALFGDEGDVRGFCSPPFPAAWTCSGAQYDDGDDCDCDCGARDPDCDADLPVRGCDDGDVCVVAACVTPPANDDCERAIPLTVPGTTMGSTLGGANDYAPTGGEGSCTPTDESGPDVVYRVALTTGQHLEVEATAADHDLSLYLLRASCDATASTCAIGVDARGFGEGETLVFIATTAGDYFLVVDSFFDGYAGPFALEATLE